VTDEQSRRVVAVDGPGGSGKSTVARGVATRLGMRYLDTGAMYRALSWVALEHRVDIEDAEAVAELAERAVLSVGTDPEAATICVDGHDVSADIRTRPVTNAVSAVSAVPAVRRLMVEQQQSIIRSAGPPGIVVEGRDIGTVVAPDAQVKVFLTASSTARAKRRTADLGAAGEAAVARTRAELDRRDVADSSRAASPLAQADDAAVIDSTWLSPDEVIERVVLLAAQPTA